MATLINLRKQAEARGIRIPQKRTLKIYGITEREWLSILSRQGWKCPVCHKTEATWNTDHEHVIGWKKMPDNLRKRYVRGILCWSCNRHVVGSYMKAHTARAIAEYLEAYEKRRDR